MQLKRKILSALLAAAMGCMALAGCSSQGGDTVSVPAETEAVRAETEPETETEPVTEHISPVETVTSSLGVQQTADVLLTREGDNTYKAKLSDFVEAGDIIQSFTFVFYAGDGSSDIGTFQGGCGISVSKDCPAATDDYWYQSDDFSAPTQGSYGEITWNVPGEIQSYVDAGGEVLIGYWWGNTQTVRLSEIICTYTRTTELPVDGTETVPVEKKLEFGSDTAKSVSVPIGDVLGEDGVPQAVTFSIRADGRLGKFTGAFGVSGGGYYQSDTIAVLTDASSLELTWILPEQAKSGISGDAEITLGYWWGEVSSITLQSVTVRYSIGGKPASVKKPESSQPVGGGAPVSGGNAAQIASDITLGWCLGNTLDCYDITWDVKNYETGWGNPYTTREMIQAVQAKGFNAVRIPVSWTDHLSEDGTVDADWMARVHEVVDYAMDCGVYTILNMHHDDYTWLNPTYADEAEVTARYEKVWQQICAEFKDYDTTLLFEGLNEPRVVGSANEWMGGTPEERDVINHLLQKFVDIVRASGGKNGERTLIVTTHAASITKEAVEGLVVPEDDNIIVSIHNYSPWKFTTLEYPDDKTFDEAGRQVLNEQMDYLKTAFLDKGIPVIIGEFGAENKDNPADRAAWAAYYVEAAAQRGIPCFFWDNGGDGSYGLLDRKSCTWYDEALVDAMIAAAK